EGSLPQPGARVLHVNDGLGKDRCLGGLQILQIGWAGDYSNVPTLVLGPKCSAAIQMRPAFAEGSLPQPAADR
ncbi:MAG: hypothetical protein ACE1Z6_11440, partial [Candidatus Methylomirabilales bacterium]